MTKEKLENANGALANLEAHEKLLEIIREARAIAIGTTSEVNAQHKEIFYTQFSSASSMGSGLFVGLSSDFFANPKIRELCCHFHEELIRILEEEVADLKFKFENL